jgi:hypothetical protein
MREPFNVEVWSRNMRAAIAARDGDRLAQLMYQNDGNGCFSYADSCHEFGDTTREEWLESLLECAADMLNFD